MFRTNSTPSSTLWCLTSRTSPTSGFTYRRTRGSSWSGMISEWRPRRRNKLRRISWYKSLFSFPSFSLSKPSPFSLNPNTTSRNGLRDCWANSEKTSTQIAATTLSVRYGGKNPRYDLELWLFRWLANVPPCVCSQIRIRRVKCDG